MEKECYARRLQDVQRLPLDILGKLAPFSQHRLHPSAERWYRHHQGEDSQIDRHHEKHQDASKLYNLQQAELGVAAVPEPVQVARGCSAVQMA